MDKANERRKRCKVKEREGEEIMICRNVIPLSRISKSFLLVIELLLILIPCVNALRFNGFVSVNIYVNVFFFYLGFLSRTFSNHRTAGEGGGHFFNSSLPLSPASLSSWVITAESSPLHIASSRTRTGNLWFPSASR